MEALKKILILCLVFSVLISCTPWRKQFLTEGIHRLTADEVAKTLGPPDATVPLDDGSIVWKYRYHFSSVSGSKERIYGSTDCTEYILTFDKGKILRQARVQDC